MKIEYKNNRLKKILSDPRLIQKHYGQLSKNIMNRLTELRSVRNLSLISKLPPPRRHLLTGEYEKCWAVDVSKNYRLIFKPVESQINFFEDKIDKIIIIDILDYH